MTTSPIWQMSDEEFKNLVKSCKTYTEILSHFGLMNRGDNHLTLKRRIDQLGLKFKSQYVSVFLLRKKPIEEILVKGSRIQNHALKKRLIKEKVIEEKCSLCNQGNSWQGKYLSLHLDHINGDSTDNRLKNIRFLCPNCHSQTSNYCGKSKRHPVKLCSRCQSIIAVKNKSNLCFDCLLEKRKRQAREIFEKTHPSKEELAGLIAKMPMIRVADKFGVSDKAVVKWLKKYGLKIKFKRGEWAKRTLTKKAPPKKVLQKRALWTSKELQKKFGVSEKIITRWYREYNIQRPNASFWANKRWNSNNAPITQR